VSNNDWFKNLKVGDAVAVRASVIGWGPRATVPAVPVTIVRETPTQWVLENGDRLRKDTGALAGGRYVVGGAAGEWTTEKRTAWADHRDRKRLRRLIAEFDVDARSIHEVTAMLNWFMHNDKAKS